MMLDRKGAEPMSVPHQLILQDRSKLELSGVIEVDCFDDNQVRCRTSLGELTVSGSDLRVFRLDVDGTTLSVEGRIESLIYTDVKRGGLLDRLFR